MIPAAEEDHAAVLALHLYRELASVCPHDPDILLEAAESAVRYISMGLFAHRSIPDPFIHLLVARLLWTLGYAQESRDYLEQRVDDPLEQARYRLFIHADGSLDECWLILQSRALVQREWISVDQDACWVIDLERFVDGSGIFTELSLFQGLQRMFDLLGHSWDEHQGPHALGFKGLKHPAHVAHAAEILAFCSETLAAMAAERAWAHVPQVFALDRPRAGRKTRAA